MIADDFRHQNTLGLAQHAGFRLNTAHAPAYHADTVDHRGMGVRTHESVREINAVLFHDARRQIFHVHLVDDAHGGGNHGKGLKSLLAPFEKFITFRIALEFNVQVFCQRGRAARPGHLHAMVHDQVHGHQRFNNGGVFSKSGHSGAHGGQVHQKGNAGQVLENDAGYGERDFIGTGIFRVPGGQIVHILFRHF